MSQAPASKYKDTIFLPRTSFPAKIRPETEEALLARWDGQDLYGRLRRAGQGRPRYVLHDGPPYANGDLHLGHALNKILKDIVTRFRQMEGFDSVYVPGWDCHGLPIEWKVEEGLRAGGKRREDLSVTEFRDACRAFAAHWVGEQGKQFRRLGIEGDWRNPYTTMTFGAEATIAGEILNLLMQGFLYRSLRPVMWSVVEKTALAEAEVNYADRVSHAVTVRFPLPGGPGDGSASAVIWTTTPWTLPANQAIAFHPDLAYSLFAVRERQAGSRAVPGEMLVLADSLADAVAGACGARLERVAPVRLGGCRAAHPLRGQGYDHDIPLLPASFVTADQGTGLVHVAPGHGEDDFALGSAHGLPVLAPVCDDGRYQDDLPLFGGKAVLTPDGREGDAGTAVRDAIDAAGCLLAGADIVHSCPHSWRSGAPVIFRATRQWFVSMEVNDLRHRALGAIDDTRWIPARGRNRIRGMIASRPDWVLSRQRAWGVPLPIFMERESGRPLMDPDVNARIIAAFAAEGANCWFTSPARRFLGPDHDPEAFTRVTDIADVWFDSACTHVFVLGQRPDLCWPASLCLEGSDQHRGWFHSSLLHSCASRGRAPYDAVLTHGFVMDAEGRKMSKSLGNIITPAEVIARHGADLLRLWVASSDYTEDLRLGPGILDSLAGVCRRLRNTLRYLLGCLGDAPVCPPGQEPADLPGPERWILHRLALTGEMRRTCSHEHDYHRFWTELFPLIVNDLSALYLDIRKDCLYCDPPDSPRRRACLWVLDRIFHCLVTWIAPLLCFTAEEAWLARHGDNAGSVHLQPFPDIPANWRDDAIGEKWERLLGLRRLANAALEAKRREKLVGSGLQARITLCLSPEEARMLADEDLATIMIVSEVCCTGTPPPGDAVRLAGVGNAAIVVGPARGEKCARCWRVDPGVGSGAVPDLCPRCADAIA